MCRRTEKDDEFIGCFGVKLVLHFKYFNTIQNLYINFSCFSNYKLLLFTTCKRAGVKLIFSLQ